MGHRRVSEAQSDSRSRPAQLLGTLVTTMSHVSTTGIAATNTQHSNYLTGSTATWPARGLR